MSLLYHIDMEKRKNTAAVADGNGTAVQKEESKFTRFMRIKRNLSICFNFIYIIAYMAFTVFTFAGDNAQITWLPYVFGGFIVVYMVLFIASLAIAKNDRRKQNTVKDYKSGLKIVKKLLKLVNLVLAIALVVNAVSGDRNIFSLVLSCVSVLYVIYQIIAEIRKMIKRRKKLRIKEKKDECDKKFLDDVKQIWNGEDVKENNALPSPDANEAATPGEESAVAASEAESAAQSSATVAVSKQEGIVATDISAEKKKSGLTGKISDMGKAATKKINEVKKSATDKIETVKSTAEKAKKISVRAKEYYGERKKIEEEMSGKKKKSQDKS